MSDVTDRDRRVLLSHRVFEAEKDIFAAQREVRVAQAKVDQKRSTYHKKVAEVVGCSVGDLKFSDSVAFFGTRLVSHCVWDLRSPNARWPFCVFCGSPRDGE